MIKQQTPNLMGNICLQSFIYDHIEDPLTVLNSFFDYRNLTEHLNHLNQWKQLVETNAYAEINTMNNPLYDHKMMVNLLNAAFIIYQTKDATGWKRKETEEDIFMEAARLNEGFDLGYLDVSMLIEPYLGIAKVFEYFTLQQYHEQLYEWLNVSLSPNVRIENADLVATIYRNLQLLIESAWLICDQQKLDHHLCEDRPAIKLEQYYAETGEREIPEHVMKNFRKFLDLVPAERLNRSLRKMLMDYLFYNQSGLPNDFEELLTDLYWLTDLLDEIQGKTVDTKFM